MAANQKLDRKVHMDFRNHMKTLDNAFPLLFWLNQKDIKEYFT
jgi:hypothetical protein